MSNLENDGYLYEWMKMKPTIETSEVFRETATKAMRYCCGEHESEKHFALNNTILGGLGNNHRVIRIPVNRGGINTVVLKLPMKNGSGRLTMPHPYVLIDGLNEPLAYRMGAYHRASAIEKNPPPFAGVATWGPHNEFAGIVAYDLTRGNVDLKLASQGRFCLGLGEDDKEHNFMVGVNVHTTSELSATREELIRWGKMYLEPERQIDL
jgi:hypothetical protein